MPSVRKLNNFKGYHIETDLGIVNVYLDLHDRKGRRVETIEILAPDYAGEKKIQLLGCVTTRMRECLKARN